jgi:hypothetical protein
MRKYYTLFIREDGRWGPQFGDFDRQCVTDEARDSYGHVKAKDRRIVGHRNVCGLPEQIARNFNEEKAA